MANLTVAFPEPCGEAWESMASVGCDRRCASCDRVVYDLANLTVEATENLLNNEERVCVRAEISADGVIKTLPSARAMVLGAGALLLAACQSVPGGRIENGFRLSGSVGQFPTRPEATISNASGESVDLRIGRDGKFDVEGLPRGTYTLIFTDRCGDPEGFTRTVVVDADVNLGKLPWEYGCIVVGHLVRERRPELG